MKFALAICVCVAVVYAQNKEVVPETKTRDLPADVLRDFPGSCYASTACRMFQVNQTWPLTPFCGRATCVEGPNGLIERVEDCGMRPKKSAGCKVSNTEELQGLFPFCCPKYSCEPGAELVFPTDEELKEAAEARKSAALGPQ
ncbi:hypothetical protein SK128_014356 [Halocaridina rubra]|uniref:Single domain-containing protein n=1 Tax=Halocaridina rubra TaxID=373956 RepID=A0AAN8X1P8_HALRR